MMIPNAFLVVEAAWEETASTSVTVHTHNGAAARSPQTPLSASVSRAYPEPIDVVVLSRKKIKQCLGMACMVAAFIIVVVVLMLTTLRGEDSSDSQD